MNYLEKKKESLMKRSPNIVHITENDTYPIHLHNCTDQLLHINKIYGKSSQASEPTDLNPVFIESTGFKNLFDSMQLFKASATVHGNYYGKDDTYCTRVGGTSSVTGTNSTNLYDLFGVSNNKNGYKIQINKHIVRRILSLDCSTPSTLFIICTSQACYNSLFICIPAII